MEECSLEWNSYELMHMADITYATLVKVSEQMFFSQHEVNKSLPSSFSDRSRTSWHLRWGPGASLPPLPTLSTQLLHIPLAPGLTTSPASLPHT